MKRPYIFGWTTRGMAFVASLAFALTAAAAYHTIKRIPIAGDTGWDYIAADSQARRLYVPHGIEVVVLDLDSGTVVGKVSGLNWRRLPSLLSFPLPRHCCCQQARP
jgi:hypothetical protein